METVQGRLDRINSLKGDICNLRHELDGVAGYNVSEETVDMIARTLLMKEIQLCAAENNVNLSDDDAEKLIREKLNLLETEEHLEDVLLKCGIIKPIERKTKVVSVETQQGICPLCGEIIELDELLSPFVTQYPEVFSYHCPKCGTTGTQTVTQVTTYPVRHTNVRDGMGNPVRIQEPKEKKEPVIPVAAVKQYLLGLLDKWDQLGDRKYELPNMQVYNHVRAELDDLAKYCKKHGFNA